jgi:tRNA nucleotidyltransferase (CCA-adding enzyme)
MGFSGYACELLVITHGNFSKVIKAAAKWVAPKLIGTEKSEFRDQSLVLIDPVDSRRNVAANLSCKNFIIFANAAKRFVSQPSEAYFFPAKPKALSENNIMHLAKRGTYFFAVVMEKPDIIEDTLYPQMRKALSRLEGIIEKSDFPVLRNFQYTNNEIIFLFEMEVWNLPKVKKMIGPPIFSRQHGKEFIKKYRKVSVEGTYWTAEKEREFTAASQLLTSLLTKGWEGLRAMGIPEAIAKGMQKAKLLEGKEFWDFVKKDEKFSEFLGKEYFSEL